MAIERTSIDGLLVLRWPRHDDARGSFGQTMQVSGLEAMLGREVRWRQSNHARSLPGVIRGFHAEPWDKCVYVARGTALAAVADIRPDSATFGEVQTFHLGDAPGEQIRLFISEGLANSYCTYGQTEVDYLYEVSQEYRPVDRLGVAFDDPDLGVAWPVSNPILSDADRANPTLRERFSDHPRFRTSGTAR